MKKPLRPPPLIPDNEFPPYADPKDSAAFDFGNGVRWFSQPRQKELLYCAADEVLYGGAAGGGKSDTALAFSIGRRYLAPGSSGLILRRTLTELQKEGSLIPRSHELLSGSPYWKWSDQKKKWTCLYNKSVIEFGYCDNEKDVYKYQSAQYDDIVIDEATHFTASMIEYLKTRARSRRGFKPLIRFFTNPGNIGHAYFKSNYVDAAPWGQTFYVNVPMGNGTTQKISRCFIHARLQHNEILMRNDPMYLARLRSMPDEHLRRALEEGDWDIFAGQYFSEWRRELHVCEPFKIPDHWNRFICMDWGKDKPSAVYWIALSETGRAYVYREFYKSGLISSQLAHVIVKLSQIDFPNEKAENVMKRYRFFAADPSIFAEKGEAPESIGSTMQGILKRNIIPAKNDRINGWMRVHEWFAPMDDGKPWMQFFSTCTHAIRTIPQLIHDEHIPEDVNSDGEDHAGDAIRYFSVTRPAPTKKLAEDPLKDLSLKDAARWERFNKEIDAVKKGARDSEVQKFLDSITT